MALLAAGTANIILVKTIKNSTNRLHFLYADQAAKSGIEIALTKIKHGEIHISDLNGTEFLNGTINNCTYHVSGTNDNSTLKLTSVATCPDGTIRTVEVEAEAGTTPSPPSDDWVPFYFADDLDITIREDSNPLAGNGQIYVAGDLKVNDETEDAAKSKLEHFGFNPVDSAPAPNVNNIKFTNVTEKINEIESVVDYYHSNFPNVPEVNIPNVEFPTFPDIEVDVPSVNCDSADTVCCSAVGSSTVEISFDDTIKIENGTCLYQGMPKNEIEASELDTIHILYVDGDANITIKTIVENGLNREFLSKVFLYSKDVLLNVKISGKAYIKVVDERKHDNISDVSLETLTLGFYSSENMTLYFNDYEDVNNNQREIQHNLVFYSEDSIFGSGTFGSGKFDSWTIKLVAENEIEANYSFYLKNSNVYIKADTLIARYIGPAYFVNSNLFVKANIITYKYSYNSLLSLGYLTDNSTVYVKANNLTTNINHTYVFAVSADFDCNSIDSFNRCSEGMFDSKYYIDIKDVNATEALLYIFYTHRLGGTSFSYWFQNNLIAFNIDKAVGEISFQVISDSEDTPGVNNATVYLNINDLDLESGSWSYGFGNSQLLLNIDTFHNSLDSTTLSMWARGNEGAIFIKGDNWQFDDLGASYFFSDSGGILKADIKNFSTGGRSISFNAKQDSRLYVKFDKLTMLENDKSHKAVGFYSDGDNATAAVAIKTVELLKEYDKIIFTATKNSTTFGRIEDLKFKSRRQSLYVSAYKNGTAYVECRDINSYDRRDTIETATYSSYNPGRAYIHILQDATVDRVLMYGGTIFAEGDVNYYYRPTIQIVWESGVTSNLVIKGTLNWVGDSSSSGNISFAGNGDSNSTANILVEQDIKFKGLQVGGVTENCTANIVAKGDVIIKGYSYFYGGEQTQYSVNIEGDTVITDMDDVLAIGVADSPKVCLSVLGRKEVRFTDVGTRNFPCMIVFSGDEITGRGYHAIDNYYPYEQKILFAGKSLDLSEFGVDVWENDSSSKRGISKISLISYGDKAEISNFSVPSDLVKVYGLSYADLLWICGFTCGKAQEIACTLTNSTPDSASAAFSANATVSSGIKLLKYIVK